MKLRYFAWVRERIGQSEEIIDPPEGVDDIAGLIAWLAGRDESYAAAFSEPQTIHAAFREVVVPLDHEQRATQNRAVYSNQRKEDP